VTVVNNSSVSVIPVDGLASGSHYQVHVESLSVSGVANSKSVSFKTERESNRQLTSEIWIPSVVSIAVILIAILIVVFVRSRG